LPNVIGQQIELEQERRRWYVCVEIARGAAILLRRPVRPLYRGRAQPQSERARGMTTEAETIGKTHPFQAEAAELLRLMVHSVYSETDIFLRELISNASDACDRLRYEAIAKPGLLGADGALVIRITPDAAAGTLTIADTGIGMDQQELIDNLGTVARSGTRAFRRKFDSRLKNGGQPRTIHNTPSTNMRLSSPLDSHGSQRRAVEADRRRGRSPRPSDKFCSTHSVSC
jgi:hypothetical protein